MKKKQEEMVLHKENNKNWEERYFDDEIEYVDERCVSLDMTQGTEDCVEYLDSGIVDDEVLRLKNSANTGKFYREPFCSEVGFTNTNTYAFNK